METNEIMVNEEMFDVAEEIATTGPSKGLKIGLGVGVAVGLGALAYKFVVKPVVAKIKAKRAAEAGDSDIVYLEADEVDSCED